MFLRDLVAPRPDDSEEEDLLLERLRLLFLLTLLGTVAGGGSGRALGLHRTRYPQKQPKSDFMCHHRHLNGRWPGDLTPEPTPDGPQRARREAPGGRRAHGYDRGGRKRLADLRPRDRRELPTQRLRHGLARAARLRCTTPLGVARRVAASSLSLSCKLPEFVCIQSRSMPINMHNIDVASPVEYHRRIQDTLGASEHFEG